MRRATPKSDPKKRPRRRRRSPRFDALEARALLATITVDTAADEDARDGTLSLREAIEVADGTLGFNALSAPEQAQVALTPGVSLIKFAIPGGLASYRIEPSSALPAITAPVTIDGTSQPGYAGKPIIELVGDGVPTLRYGSPTPAYGLTLAATGITVQGLVINEFGDAQVGIDAPGGDVIRGDYLGTDVSGTVAKPNPYRLDFGNGLDIVGSSHNTVGGTTAADRDVISGNSTGVFVVGTGGTGGAGVGSSGNVIDGDFIGTDATGTGAVPNAGSGINFYGNAGGDATGGNTIGGTAAGAGNVISGNGPTTPHEFAEPGILLNGVGGGGNVVAGNVIGLDAAGLNPLPNRGAGIDVEGGTRGVTIGGIVAGAGNVIADNTGTGVLVGQAGDIAVSSATGIAIEGNSIYGNARVGIDLDGDGVTPNTPGVPSGSSNNHQNYPAILAATAAAAGTDIVGTLNGAPVTTFRVEFFGNPEADPSGYGQGRTFLGATSVTTDGSGRAPINATVPGDLTGQFLSATATDPAGDTSEFARDFQVGSPALAATTTTLTTSENPADPADSITFTATVAAPSGGTPTGSVVFTLDGQPKGTGTLAVVDGRSQATYTYNPYFSTYDGVGSYVPPPSVYLASGDHVVTATYEGDSAFAPATAPALTQAVTPFLPVQLNFGSGPLTPTAGQPFSIGAAVVPEAGGTPTGTVRFTFRGVTTTVPVTIIRSSYSESTGASLRVPGLPVGHYTAAATYSGDATHAGTSATISFDVSRNLPTKLNFTVTPGHPVVGQTFTVTATVVPVSGLGTPTGSVRFQYFEEYDKFVPLVLVHGVATATFTVPITSAGSYEFTVANYSGDGNFAASGELGPVVTVAPAPPQPPRVTGLHRLGSGSQLTKLVLDFSGPLEVPHTEDVSNYILTGPLDRTGGTGPAVAILSAVYDAATRTVTLTTAQPLVASRFALYSLKIRGGIGGLRGANGVRLAGSGDTPGTSSYGSFRGAGPQGA